MVAGLDHGAPARRDRGFRPPLPPLVPAAIARHVKSLTDDGSGPSEDDVREKIMELANTLRRARTGANAAHICHAESRGFESLRPLSGSRLPPGQIVGGHFPSTYVASESPGQGGMETQMNVRSASPVFRY